MQNESQNPLRLAALTKAQAHTLGFDACAIARVDGPADPEDKLGRWLGWGFHADMAWMARTRALRQDVRLRLPQAQSVVVVARNYYTPTPPPPPGTGKIARYARGKDYHKVLKPRLVRLAQFLDGLEPGAASFVSVDSGPVMERTWAEHAGLGWIGKNGLVLRRDLGSWFLLGAVVTSVSLAVDPPYPDLCGTCTACLDACPTKAFTEPGVVDSNRCISYHTIENHGEIPEALQAQFEGWVFGCDICQEVCPWNRFAPVTTETAFAPRPECTHPPLDELQGLDEESFDQRFAGTPIRRTKWSGMHRNAKIASKTPG